jgi:uncharacterized membrane protein
MWSDVIYELGPLVVGAVAAALIAAYLWSRSRVASLFVVVWFGLAAAIGQVSFFEGPLTWAESHALGFAAFGTLSFAPAVVLLIAVFRSERIRRFIAAIPTWALLLTQAYRAGGAFLIMAHLRGELPGEVGLVSGPLDLLVAASSVVLAVRARRHNRSSVRSSAIWSIVSLADFAWAIAVLQFSYLGVIELSPDPIMMGNSPLLVISLFALPLAIVVSVIVLVRAIRPSLLSPLRQPAAR